MLKNQADVVYPFNNPIKRSNDNEVKEVSLRKPSAGELRGLNLMDVIQLNTDALIKLIPRISSPTLTEFEVASLGLDDIFGISTKIAGFFGVDGI